MNEIMKKRTNFNKEVSLNKFKKTLAVLKKKISKDSWFKVSKTNEQDDLPGISVKFINGGKVLPILDIECDIYEKQITINVWEDDDRSKEEIVINY